MTTGYNTYVYEARRIRWTPSLPSSAYYVPPGTKMKDGEANSSFDPISRETAPYRPDNGIGVIDPGSPRLTPAGLGLHTEQGHVS